MDIFVESTVHEFASVEKTVLEARVLEVTIRKAVRIDELTVREATLF